MGMTIKKLLASALAVCICASCAVSAFAAANFDDDGNRDEETGLPDDEMDVIIDESRPWHELDNPDDAYMEDLEYDEYIRLREEYNETVKRLESFGIWDQISDNSYLAPITVGEYCASVCSYINFRNVYLPADTPEEKGRKAYELLKQNGTVDFELDPNGEIFYEDAVRILVNALGYKQFMNGDDYMSLAVTENIAERMPEDMTKPITRLWAAYLFDDSTNAECYAFNGTGFERRDVLEYYKHIYRLAGTVEAVDDMYVTKGGPANGGIRIDGLTMTSTLPGLTDYLGCRVTAYYESGTYDGDVLKYITYYSDDYMMTIEGENIIGFYDGRIEYTDGSRARSERLENDAIEILNGFSPSEPATEDFENCDYVRLVDSDGNGRYDIAFVYKYDILVVERVAGGTIYGALNGDRNASLEVDFGSSTLELTDRVGNPVDDYYITNGSVLSVAKDPHSTEMKIIVSNMYYTGIVTGLSYDNDYSQTVIRFDGREYKYSTNHEYIKALGGLKAGRQYTVLLDYRRRIAGFEEEKASDMLYGYLVRAWIENEGEERVALQLLPFTGDMGTYYPSNTAVIDSVSCKSPTDMRNALYTAAMNRVSTLTSLDDQYEAPDNGDGSSVVYIGAPVLYKQNEDGEITYIDTPYHSENEKLSGADGSFSDGTMTMYEPFSKRSGTSTRPGGMFLRNTLAFNSDNGNNVAVDTDTKVFVVPVSNDPAVLRNYDNYQKSNLAYFKDWVYYPQEGDMYETANRIEAYNVNDARAAEVIVYYTSDAVPEIDKKVPLTVVDEVIKAVDEDGAAVNRLVGWQGNAEISVDLADGVYMTKYYNGPDGEKLASTVRRGDIIRYVTNNAGELVDYVKVFSLTDEDDPDYIKAGNEYGVSANPAELNNTLLAVSDGKYAENGHNTPHIYNAVGSYNYGATYRVVYGTLMYKNGTNLVLKTTTDTAMGPVETTEIADFSGFNVLCIDEAADRIYVPREEELLSELNVGEEDASKVILHTEGGKQGQLIIVKREK